jgi:hypothetical protein
MTEEKVFCGKNMQSGNEYKLTRRIESGFETAVLFEELRGGMVIRAGWDADGAEDLCWGAVLIEGKLAYSVSECSCIDDVISELSEFLGDWDCQVLGE